MLGAVIAVICMTAFFVGLEAGSPGALNAAIHAFVAVSHATETHVGQKICAQLAALGDHAAVCPAL